MNPREQNMQGFLSRAASIIAKSDAIAPLPQKNIPTLAESAAAELGYSGGYTQPNYQQPQYQQQQYQQPVYAPQPTYAPNGGISPASKRLPSAILDSLQSNPIQDYNGPMGGVSVLDNIMPPPQPRQQRQQMNEEYYDGKQMPTTEELLMRSRALREQIQPQYQQPQQGNTGGGSVDYSLIKTIIAECVANEFKKLRKAMADDSVVMTVGNNVKFITKTGAVFEGKMKKTGQLDMG